MQFRHFYGGFISSYQIPRSTLVSLFVFKRALYMNWVGLNGIFSSLTPLFFWSPGESWRLLNGETTFTASVCFCVGCLLDREEFTVAANVDHSARWHENCQNTGKLIKMCFLKKISLKKCENQWVAHSHDATKRRKTLREAQRNTDFPNRHFFFKEMMNTKTLMSS